MIIILKMMNHHTNVLNNVLEKINILQENIVLVNVMDIINIHMKDTNVYNVVNTIKLILILINV